MWVDDSGFDIAHHVDDFAPSSTGPLSGATLRRTVGVVFGGELDMTRPLCGLTLLGVLDDGRQA